MKFKLFLLLAPLLATATYYAENDMAPKVNTLRERPEPLKVKHPERTKGELTVFCGSMCAEKSGTLIAAIGRLHLAGVDVLTFKPSIDNRDILNLGLDPRSYISSRNGSWVDCTPVQSCAEMRHKIAQSNASVIAIDEAHFFTPESSELIALVRDLVQSRKLVLIAGLELDFRSEPFGPMPSLLAFADHVIKLKAICSVCGADTYCLSQRLIDGKPAGYNDPLIVVGASQYEPRCRKCHVCVKPTNSAATAQQETQTIDNSRE